MRKHGLQERIPPEAFEIESRPRWRTIRCRYGVPVMLLPGWTRTLHFRIHVEEPRIEAKETKFF